MAKVITQLNRYRIAPRKVRAVVNLIKGMPVLDAVSQLEFLIKRPSGGIIKLLKSAIANAENNFNMVKENLIVKSIAVNEGIKLKRFKPKGFGRAAAIQKKTSHVRLILEEKVPGLKRQEAVRPAEREQAGYVPAKEEKSIEDAKRPSFKRELGRKSGIIGNLKKKFFQRKVV